MTDAEIRLEILKVCHRHDRPTSEVIERCGCIESYILGLAQSDGRAKQGSRNPRAEKAQAPA